MASVGSLAQHSARRCSLAVRAYLLGCLLVPSSTSNRDIVWLFFLAGMALSSVAALGLLGVCPFEYSQVIGCLWPSEPTFSASTLYRLNGKRHQARPL